MLKVLFKKHILIFLGILILAAFLRIPFLDKFPPALYSDEVNQGYNAYSILKTARDEHGALLPVSFRSFGDWKPPVQTYLMVPTIALFGLNEWGVRLPSALFGIVTVGMIYFCVNELFVMRGKSLGLMGMLLLAISPWHVQQSRCAMLIAVALFFLTLTVLAFLKGLKKPIWFSIASFSAVGAIYSYYGMRLIIPLLGFFLLWYFRRRIKFTSKEFMTAVIIGVVCMVPLGIAYLKNPDVVFGRARTVSVFYDQGVELRLWEGVTQDGLGASSKITQFFHNRPILYILDILRRFLSHLDGEFLFLKGDTSLPFQIPNMGIIYIIDGIFIVIGTIFMLRFKRKQAIILLTWILIVILPAALSYLTPSANRSFNMIVPLMIFSAYGIMYSWNIVKKNFKFPFILLLSSVYVISFVYFCYQYIVILPKQHADWWYFGYKELVSFINSKKDNYDEVVISERLSMPYIYLLFFDHYDPYEFRREVYRNFKADQFGFEHVVSFARYRFPQEFSWEKEYSKFAKKTLLILTPEESVGKGAEYIESIFYPNHKEAYRIYSIETNKIYSL